MRRFLSIGALALAGMLGVSDGARAQSGVLVSGFGYSDRYGGFGNIGLHLREIFGGGFDLRAEYRRGGTGYDISARALYRHRLGATGLGPDTTLSFGAAVQDSHWQINPYNSRSLDLFARLETQVTPNLRWQVAAVHSMADLTISAPGISPVLLQDAGQSSVTWLEGGFAWTSVPDAGLFTPGTRVTGLLAHSVSGDPARRWSRARAGIDTTIAIGGPVVLGLTAEGSMIAPSGGAGRIHALDRIFPDGRSPRGFAWGSAGPYDTLTTDPLGGTRQAFFSAELRAPLPAEGLSVGLFADAGSVWNLAGDAGGDTEDGFFLRTSAGVSLIWTTRFGRLDASWAAPITVGPNDVRQPFSLRFVAQF